MDVLSRQQAQARVDSIHAFRAELERLTEEGTIDLDGQQRGKLFAHHQALLDAYAREFDVDRDSQAKQLSMGMRVASFFGAIAMAASVFFLFYQFWGLFGVAVQVAVLVGSALASFVLTMWLHRRDSSGYFTKLAALVAFACFVLNIGMFGQIFNITPSDNALLAWAALGFVLAYACELRLLLVAAIVCLSCFVAARAGTWGGMYWLGFGEKPENFLPVAALLFFLPQWFSQERFAGFAATYRVSGLLCLLLPMLVLANWGWGSYLPWSPDFIEGLYQLAGFACSAAAVWLGIRRHWADTANTGVVFFVIFLYTKFYDWWWEIMPKFLFFLVLGLTALLVLFVLRRLRGAGGRT